MRLNKLSGAKVYLFGSSVYSNDYGDLDIAIIYSKADIRMDDLLNYRRYLKAQMLDNFNCSCDILLLSEQEEREAEFLRNAKSEKLFESFI